MPDSKNTKRESVPLTPEQWAALDKVAEETNSVATTGLTAGQPSWRALLRRITNGELTVKETRTMTPQWHQMNWQQAVTIMANSSLYENDKEREQAAQRIMIDIDRQDDEGVWEWVMNGDWTGDETPESVTEELADLEAE